MKTLLISTLSLFLLFSSTAQHEIGHMTKTFVDASRSNRNIQTEIYYPATSAGNNTPASMGEYPVIVFGHGLVMTWDTYTNLWEEFPAVITPPFLNTGRSFAKPFIVVSVPTDEFTCILANFPAHCAVILKSAEPLYPYALEPVLAFNTNEEPEL